MFTRIFELAFDRVVGVVDCCPWVGHAYGLQPARSAAARSAAARVRPPYLYTPEQRRRRDATPWTMVQGVLAPVQFLVFLLSFGCVLHYLATGQGLHLATMSILVKTCFLLLIMVTGAIWEREVFGQYLFAPAFYWEDVFSFLVIGLHSFYVAILLTGAATPRVQMLIALAAYASYVINAAQFLMKLRAARRQAPAVAGQTA